MNAKQSNERNVVRMRRDGSREDAGIGFENAGVWDVRCGRSHTTIILACTAKGRCFHGRVKK